jgi:hypothetical protein
MWNGGRKKKKPPQTREKGWACTVLQNKEETATKLESLFRKGPHGTSGTTWRARDPTLTHIKNTKI